MFALYDCFPVLYIHIVAYQLECCRYLLCTLYLWCRK